MAQVVVTLKPVLGVGFTLSRASSSAAASANVQVLPPGAVLTAAQSEVLRPVLRGLPGAQASGVFVLDVTAVGVVATKVYETKSLLSCTTDSASVRVHVGCDGGSGAYTPTVSVNGVAVSLIEPSPRWFTGYADIPLPTVGENVVTVASSVGPDSQLVVTRRSGGAEVLGVEFGPYPGAQTALKAGDTLGVTVHTDPTAVQVSIYGGAVASCPPLPVNDGVATGTLTIGSHNGAATFTVAARNGFGTYGDAVVTPSLTLDQTYPVFGAFAVAYPPGQGALDTAQVANVTCAVSNADAVTYNVSGLSVEQGYAPTKQATNLSTGYVASGNNYTISAVRLNNGASASASTLVKIVTVAASANITSPTRLASSPVGIDHEIRITPTQALLSAPSLTASVGAWQGSWTQVGAYWRRSLRIRDSDGKAPGTFTNLVLPGLSGIQGNAITAGVSYTPGGMSQRTLVFAAFSRVAPLGAQVVDVTKTSAAIVGGNTLARQLTGANVVNGFYVANADASYNPNGSYLGLSDAALAGANTSGSLQATFEESV